MFPWAWRRRRVISTQSLLIDIGQRDEMRMNVANVAQSTEETSRGLVLTIDDWVCHLKGFETGGERRDEEVSADFLSRRGQAITHRRQRWEREKRRGDECW